MIRYEALREVRTLTFARTAAMGDSYREELKKKKGRSGFSQIFESYLSSQRTEAEERSALRAEYFRKSRARHRPSVARQVTLW